MIPTKIAIVAFDQFTDIDVFLAWDLFNRIRHSAWEVKIVGTSTSHSSVTGISIQIHEGISWANEADIVFFSSGPGVRQAYRDENYLKHWRLNPDRQLIGSMCSGALVLAALGLIKGKATTYPTSRPLLEEIGIEVVHEDIVVNGNVATAAGCLAAINMIQWMITERIGQQASDFVINAIQPVTKGLVCSYGATLEL